MTTLALPSSVMGQLGKLSGAIKLGIIADTHIGFVDDAEDRFGMIMREMELLSPDGLVQLGDFVYPDKRYQRIADRFNAGAGVTIHTIGNHDLDHSHTREDCMKAWGFPSPYYTRNVKGLRVIVLDGNEKGSPTHALHGGYPSYIGPVQQEWLSDQLSMSDSPVMIASHQPLAGRSAIDNADEVQKILSRHRDKILLSINGHSHIDQHIEIDGVNYLHFNSASYFWLGGKVRLAKYKDPLYASMTIDPGKKQIRIDGVESQWLSGTPEDVDYFTGKNAGIQEMVVPRIRNRMLPIQTQK